MGKKSTKAQEVRDRDLWGYLLEVTGEKETISAQDALVMARHIYDDLVAVRTNNLTAIFILEQFLWEKDHPHSQERLERNAEQEARAFVAGYKLIEEDGKERPFDEREFASVKRILEKDGTIHLEQGRKAAPEEG